MYRRIRTTTPARKAAIFIAAVEPLENRILLSAITVSNLLDSGPGSLRAAVTQANADSTPDTIQFQSGLTGTIDLTTSGNSTDGPSALLISHSMTIAADITGPGIAIARDAGALAMRLFTIATGATLTLQNLTLSGGLAQGGAGGSGGRGGGGGAAGLGGAIFNAGSLNISGCTFTNNQAIGAAGGSGSASITLGGAGGGGLVSGGQPGSSSGPGGNGGAPSGGKGGTASTIGAPGGFGGGGGGGAGEFTNSTSQAAGNGGFGAGGGARGGGSGPGGYGGFGGGGGYGDPGSGLGGFAGGNQDNSSFGGGGGAGLGGAIFNDAGAVSIANSTFTLNTAQGGSGGASAQSGAGLGGAIFNYTGSLSALNCTLSGNSADAGREVYNLADASAATVTLNNDILGQSDTSASDYVDHNINGGTSASSGIADLIRTASGFGGSLVSSADPQLGALANNGGPTQTLLPADAGPAVNAGNSAAAASLTIDQRGLSRFVGSAIDIGSIETDAVAPAITSSSSATFTASSTATFTFTATGSPTPTFSEQGTIPSGLTFTNNGDGTATLAGTPAAFSGGAYHITLTATNGSAAVASQNFTLAIDQSPAVTPSNASFVAAVTGTFTIHTTGFPAPAMQESGLLPAGITFTDNGNGSANLSGTPAADAQGSYAITISASNGTAPDASKPFTLLVGLPPQITSAAAGEFSAGTSATFQVTTTGFPIASLSESGLLPSGVTFTDNHDGTAALAGTPANGGRFVITLTAANNVLPNARQSFTLTVDQSPTITSAANVTFYAGLNSSFTIQTTGSPAASISESGSLPAGINFTDNNDGTATLSGVPTLNSINTYPLTINAANSIGSANPQSLSLNVVGTPPILVGQLGLRAILTLYNPDGSQRLTIIPYPNMPQAVPTVALADFNNDGTPDILTSTGPGARPRVKIFDGKTGAQVVSFLAFNTSFSGGLFVAAADVTGDGTPDIIIGQGAGALSRVRVYDGKTFNRIANFQAYPNTFTGGVRVAAADLNNDGHADLIVSPGPGSPQPLEVFDGAQAVNGVMLILDSNFPFGSAFNKGIFVAAGDVNSDGTPDVIASEDAGGQPLVRVFSGTNFARIASFTGLDASFHGGARVGVQILNGAADIVVSSGIGDNVISIFNGADDTLLATFDARKPAKTTGLFAV